MSLLNYTTTIKASKTASEIGVILVKGGARKIMSEYDDDGNVVAISFTVTTPHGERAFTLPVKVEPVQKVLAKDPRARKLYGDAATERARNVAWRITKDWIEAQMALIATQMVTMDQVMLPYMRALDGGTLYEAYVAGHSMQPALEEAR